MSVEKLRFSPKNIVDWAWMA